MSNEATTARIIANSIELARRIMDGVTDDNVRIPTGTTADTASERMGALILKNITKRAGV